MNSYHLHEDCKIRVDFVYIPVCLLLISKSSTTKQHTQFCILEVDVATLIAQVLLEIPPKSFAFSSSQFSKSSLRWYWICSLKRTARLIPPAQFCFLYYAYITFPVLRWLELTSLELRSSKGSAVLTGEELEDSMWRYICYSYSNPWECKN
jgi:hypothetical protein